MYHSRFALLLLLLPVFCFAAETPVTVAATAFERELQIPGRPLFRERGVIGEVRLASAAKGRRARRAAQGTLQLVSEVAFVPGDSVRCYALSLELVQDEQIIATSILDASEIPAFWRALDYLLSTSQGISETPRADTRVQYTSAGGFSLAFRQTGTAQKFRIAFGEDFVRDIGRDPLATLKDLVDLAIFDLKRQGAAIGPIAVPK